MSRSADYPEIPITTVAAGPAHFEGALSVRSDLPYFEGHFPGNPLLPGFILVEWATRIAGSVFDRPESPVRITALKFSNPIFPGAEIRLVLDASPVRASVKFKYLSGTKLHASGVLHYR